MRKFKNLFVRENKNDERTSRGKVRGKLFSLICIRDAYRIFLVGCCITKGKYIRNSMKALFLIENSMWAIKVPIKVNINYCPQRLVYAYRM